MIKKYNLSCTVDHKSWYNRVSAAEWCIEKFGDYGITWDNDFGSAERQYEYIYYFTNKQDLALFKLTWL